MVAGHSGRAGRINAGEADLLPFLKQLSVNIDCGHHLVGNKANEDAETLQMRSGRACTWGFEE